MDGMFIFELWEWQVEGKITIRLVNGKDEENWQLLVGCSLPGKWVLHWGVKYIGDVGRFDFLLRTIKMNCIVIIISIFKPRRKKNVYKYIQRF